MKFVWRIFHVILFSVIFEVLLFLFDSSIILFLNIIYKILIALNKGGGGVLFLNIFLRRAEDIFSPFVIKFFFIEFIS